MSARAASNVADDLSDSANACCRKAAMSARAASNVADDLSDSANACCRKAAMSARAASNVADNFDCSLSALCCRWTAPRVAILYFESYFQSVWILPQAFDDR